MKLFTLISILILSQSALVQADGGPAFVLAESHCRKIVAAARNYCERFDYESNSTQDVILLGIDRVTLEMEMSDKAFMENFKFAGGACSKSGKYSMVQIDFIYRENPRDRRCKITTFFRNEDTDEMVKFESFTGDTRDFSQPAVLLKDYEKGKVMAENAIPDEPQKRSTGEAIGDFFNGILGRGSNGASGR